MRTTLTLLCLLLWLPCQGASLNRVVGNFFGDGTGISNVVAGASSTFTNLLGQAVPAQIAGTLSNDISGNATTATTATTSTYATTAGTVTNGSNLPITAGANITLTTNANSLAIASSGGGGGGSATNALVWLSFDQTSGSGLTNVVVDFTKGVEFALILTTNAFFTTPTNRPTTNWIATGMIRLYQDGTGGRSVSFTNGATTGAWKTPGAQTLVCTTNAGAGSMVSYTLGNYGTNQWYVWGLNFQ